MFILKLQLLKIKHLQIFVWQQLCKYGYQNTSTWNIIRIFRIQKRVIRLLAGVSSRTSCRQLFKESNILTVVSLYIFEVTCFIWKYCQSLEQNTQVHQHNTWRKLDLHVKMQNTEVYKKSVINMGTKVYNNLPRFLKEIGDYRAFKRKLKKFLLLQSFYSVEEFVSA